MKFINLKQFRKERGMSQKELVEKTGFSQCLVSYLENAHQEITDYQLGILREVFPEDNVESYVYEKSSYGVPERMSPSKSPSRHLIEEGDWTVPSPIDIVEGFKVICKMGRILLTQEGDLLLNRNDGSFSHRGYHIITHDKLDSSELISQLCQKDWFDAELFESFKRAYVVACGMAGIKPVEQSKSNHQLK